MILFFVNDVITFNLLLLCLFASHPLRGGHPRTVIYTGGYILLYIPVLHTPNLPSSLQYQG